MVHVELYTVREDYGKDLYEEHVLWDGGVKSTGGRGGTNDNKAF